MPSTSRLVASLLCSALLLASADVRAQSPAPQAAPPVQPSAPPPGAPPPHQAPPVQAPPVQAPPPYVTPAPQPAYPQQGYPQQGYPQQGSAQQAYPQPGYPQQGVQGVQPGWRAPPPARPSKGLMITGISIFAGSYLVAMLVGGSLLDNNRDGEEYDDDFDCRHCADVAPYLFIPLAGPFIAMSQTPNDGGLIVLGMVEMVGAALTIGGIVRYQNTKRAAAMSGYSMNLGERRTLTLDVGSSQRTVGPRMTLRF